MYIAGILTGLYKAFIINKALVWFLPQYSQIFSIVQIWVVLSIYAIVQDDDKQEDASVVIARSFKNTLVKVTALSIALLGFYIVKQYN